MLLAVGGHTFDDWDPRYVQLVSGLAGGVGSSRQEMCGALSGGVIVIGGLLGRQSAEEDDADASALAAEYRNRFLAELGDTQCDRLRRVIEAPDGPGTCAPLVEQSAAILLELLDGSGGDA